MLDKWNIRSDRDARIGWLNMEPNPSQVDYWHDRLAQDPAREGEGKYLVQYAPIESYPHIFSVFRGTYGPPRLILANHFLNILHYSQAVESLAALNRLSDDAVIMVVSVPNLQQIAERYTQHYMPIEEVEFQLIGNPALNERTSLWDRARLEQTLRNTGWGYVEFVPDDEWNPPWGAVALCAKSFPRGSWRQEAWSILGFGRGENYFCPLP